MKGWAGPPEYWAGKHHTWRQIDEFLEWSNAPLTRVEATLLVHSQMIQVADFDTNLPDLCRDALINGTIWELKRFCKPPRPYVNMHKKTPRTPKRRKCRKWFSLLDQFSEE